MIERTLLTIELQRYEGNNLRAIGKVIKPQTYTLVVKHTDSTIDINMTEYQASKDIAKDRICGLYGNISSSRSKKAAPLEDLVFEICKAIAFYTEYKGNVFIHDLPKIHYPDATYIIPQYKYLAKSSLFIIRGASIDKPELMPYIKAWVTLKQLTKEIS